MIKCTLSEAIKKLLIIEKSKKIRPIKRKRSIKTGPELI